MRRPSQRSWRLAVLHAHQNRALARRSLDAACGPSRSFFVMKRRVFRNHSRVHRMLGSVLLLGLSSAGCSKSSADAHDRAADACESLSAPADVPASVQVPAGNQLVHHFHAVGTQNYTCTETPGMADAPSTYAWVFVAPEAALSNECGELVGTHYAGPQGAATPRWQFTADGSYVQGMKVQASPVTGSIPELLLAATEASAGTLAKVTFVQRLAPEGGAAPDAAECSSANLNELRKSNYSAEYYFYAGAPPSAPSGGSGY
jgi:hypothetical protein